MSEVLKKYKKSKEKDKNNESNIRSKSKEGKTKKKKIQISSEDEEDSKEEEKDSENNYRYKTDGRRDKNKTNLRRVDRVKIMVRKEMEKEPKQKIDEDKKSLSSSLHKKRRKYFKWVG